ncbi:MAG: hypothetical protein BV456_00945 [Thermoplasmata archaeon M8B2D]|nr:MAG: hypothetical protein BV456_00945 [Thermoplasmata archaeon M8B2D]
MTQINISSSAKSIDIKKIKLEAKYNSEIKKYLDIIADVSSSIYAIRGNLNANEVSKNAKPELIFLLRSLYRDTIKIFDNSSRDFMKDKKAEGLNISKEDNEMVNQEISESSLFYVNNQSEIQSDEISKTNEKKIESAVVFALLFINNKIQKLNSDKIDAQNQLLSINQELDRIGELSIALKLKKKKLEKLIKDVDKNLQKINSNRNLAISREINKKLKELNVARSKTISAQEIGATESFIRQEEAKALSKTNATYRNVFLSRSRKRWNAILDNRTREAHALADGQIRRLDEDFIVDGENLSFPRDPRGSIGNIINCRCIIDYILV